MRQPINLQYKTYNENIIHIKISPVYVRHVKSSINPAQVIGVAIRDVWWIVSPRPLINPGRGRGRRADRGRPIPTRRCFANPTEARRAFIPPFASGRTGTGSRRFYKGETWPVGTQGSLSLEKPNQVKARNYRNNMGELARIFVCGCNRTRRSLARKSGCLATQPIA